jgi:hypothetical protein
MRNSNSSLTNLIGVVFISLVWHICHAYPDGRYNINPDHIIQRRDVSFTNNEKDAAAIDLLHQLHYPLAEKTIPGTWNPIKRHVSISENNLKAVVSKRIPKTF